MKSLLHALFLSMMCWLTAAAQQTPTANEVINKYIKALGGKEALKKIKDLSFESSLTNNGGNFTLTNRYMMPDTRLVLVKDATGKIIYQQVITSKEVLTKYEDNMIPTKPEDLQRILLGGQFVPELTLKEKKVNYTLAGTESLQGRQTYKIDYTGADGSALWTAYYDTQTGLLARTLTPFQDGPQTMDYTDYREVNGIKVPYHFSGYGSETQASQYEANKGLSNADFVIK